MGHKSESPGEGTVNIGRSDVDDIDGFSISRLLGSFSFAALVAGAFFLCAAGPNLADRDERPEITGGGNSMPSAAFFDNCLAKSDACHHSRNFRAKILVGKRIFKHCSTTSHP